MSTSRSLDIFMVLDVYVVDTGSFLVKMCTKTPTCDQITPDRQTGISETHKLPQGQSKASI